MSSDAASSAPTSARRRSGVLLIRSAAASSTTRAARRARCGWPRSPRWRRSTTPTSSRCTCRRPAARTGGRRWLGGVRAAAWRARRRLPRVLELGRAVQHGHERREPPPRAVASRPPPRAAARAAVARRRRPRRGFVTRADEAAPASRGGGAARRSSAATSASRRTSSPSSPRGRARATSTRAGSSATCAPVGNRGAQPRAQFRALPAAAPRLALAHCGVVRPGQLPQRDDQDNFVSLQRDEEGDGATLSATRAPEGRALAHTRALGGGGGDGRIAAAPALFVFGDFNFRLTLPAVVAHLAGDDGLRAARTLDRSLRVAEGGSQNSAHRAAAGARPRLLLRRLLRRPLPPRDWAKRSPRSPRLAETVRARSSAWRNFDDARRQLRGEIRAG